MDKIKKNRFQPSSWGRSSTPTSKPDTSTASLNSSTSHSYPSSSSQHPYSAHSSDVQAVLSGGNNQDEDDSCPVCLLSLSFSFRLPGEKPHVVPECGHALHEACFTSVYGPVVRGPGRQTSLGLCGVCRRPMKLGDGDNSKGNSTLVPRRASFSNAYLIMRCCRTRCSHWCRRAHYEPDVPREKWE